MPRPFPSFRLLFSLSLTGALALIAGCKSGHDGPPKNDAEVGIVTLTTQSVSLTSDLTGRVTATTGADVRPQVDGIITARLFTEGSLVKAGQPLYQIDPRLYQATLDQTRAELESAQATLATDQAKIDRYKSLTDSEAVSRQTIDDAAAAAAAAQASVHQYQANLKSAQVNLEFTRVLAPISGRIGRSSVTPGALVTASQTTALATIQQLDPIYVDITQSASALLELRRSLAQGQVLPARAAAHLTLEDGTAYAPAGSIEFAEVTVNEAAGTVTLRARFPNPDEVLLPGMFVRVQTPQGELPNGILAPQQGITRDAKGDATALLVGPDNKVPQQTVIADRAIGNKWLITSGLKAGDRLIVEGTDKVHAGATVRPVAAQLGD